MMTTVKLHALLINTPEYNVPFQSAGLAGFTVFLAAPHNNYKLSEHDMMYVTEQK
jgi:hypothetical protein